MKKPSRSDELIRQLIPPMLATLAPSLPRNSSDWIFEQKFDGFRAISAIADGSVSIRSRNGLDLKERFASVAVALSSLSIPEAVLDGEVTALDVFGVPRFQMLQQTGAPLVYFVYDLIWLDGHDLRSHRLEQRRELLETLFDHIPSEIRSVIRLTEPLAMEPSAALEFATKQGWEGLIGKRKGSIYVSRRSNSWIKLKLMHEQEFAVVGYTPASNIATDIGSLLLGVMHQGEMTFAGGVGTGFTTQQRAEFMKICSEEPRGRPVKAAPKMKDAVWLEPRLVAQVRFIEWTSDDRLRHPSFLGFRSDKAAEDCVRERGGSQDVSDDTETKKKAKAKPVKEKQVTVKAESSAKTSARGTNPRDADESPVRLTHPERLLYPRDGITKKDVVEYFEAVAEPMLHALADRPLALEHWNDGIDKPSWFQHDVTRDREPWMTIAEVVSAGEKRKIRHLIADSPLALRWMAQRSVLTTHMWSSRVGSLDSPDWIVFDLDPARGHGIEQAVDTALVLRALFDSLELPSVPKTSGKRGIHVFVPLAPNHTYDEILAFSMKVAEGVSRQVGGATVERTIEKRGERLYLDTLQNARGKTVVAPYSLRAIDGAPVSAPLAWSEVTRKLDPLKLNLRTMPDRIAKKGDLFQGALMNGVRLPRLR